MGTGKGGNTPPAASAAAAPAISILRRSVPKTVPSSVALAASNYDLGPRENYRSWLLDTGCKYDLTTRASIPLHQVDSIFRAPMPILLATANDLVQGDKVVAQQIGELGEVAEPYVLDSTPDVLSIGRRCVEDGYEFVWKPYSLHPTITTPRGRVVKLVSRDCCPYLDDYEPNYFPAASAVTQANENKRVDNSVTWDPEGPTYDEPKPRRRKSVRPQGRHPNSDFNSDSSDVYSDDDRSSPAREAGSSSSLAAQVVPPKDGQPLSALKKAAVPATDKAVPPQEGPPSGGAEAPSADLDPQDPQRSSRPNRKLSEAQNRKER
jgi:hypothetical protein